MKRLSICSVVSLSITALLGSLVLSGCSGMGGVVMPQASYQVSPGAISGSNFGGHAPVVGARLFVLEAESAGYGGKATSLLHSNVAGALQDTRGSAATNPTYGWYYLTTDASGSFNISNDYTCTSGQPVYLYSQGGTTGQTSSFSITQASSIVNGHLIVVFATATANNLSVGEEVSFAGIPNGTVYAGFNGQTFPVASGGLTSTQFEIDLGPYTGNTPATNTYSTPYPTGSVSAENPAIVNLAMLGKCPGTSGEFANTIKYVYMNEVSTAALAYSMSGFATTTAGITTDATHIGSSATNLLGLQNAALNAAQLYDIQGSNLSSVSVGEGHVARPNTPNGNGVIPNQLFNTIGNILASCVDSQNTLNALTTVTTGVSSTQCNTLFTTATTNGASSGNDPIDTATAAFNIALNPGGPAGATSTNRNTYVTNLFNLQGTNFPFAPQLNSVPNDFMAVIKYPQSSNGNMGKVESIGIDKNGNIWMNDQGNSNIFEYNPQGVQLYSSASPGYNYGYLSIDSNGNVWTGANFASELETRINVNATTGAVTGISTFAAPFAGNLFYDPYITVTDSAGNAYAAGTNPNTGTSQFQLIKFAQANGTVLNAAPTINGYNVAHGAADKTSVWLTTEAGTAGNHWEIQRILTASGQIASGFPVTDTTGGGITAISAPEMPAIDNADDLWVANQANNSGTPSVTEITAAGGLKNPTGGTLIHPFGTAVDGLGHVWVAERGATSGATTATGGLLEYNSTTATVISPTTDNYSAGGLILAPLNLEADASGVLWITSYDDNVLYEMLGTAAPTTTPRSVASGNNGLGARP